MSTYSLQTLMDLGLMFIMNIKYYHCHGVYICAKCRRLFLHLYFCVCPMCVCISVKGLFFPWHRAWKHLTIRGKLEGGENPLWLSGSHCCRMWHCCDIRNDSQCCWHTIVLQLSGFKFRFSWRFYLLRACWTSSLAFSLRTTNTLIIYSLLVLIGENTKE